MFELFFQLFPVIPEIERDPVGIRILYHIFVVFKTLARGQAQDNGTAVAQDRFVYRLYFRLIIAVATVGVIQHRGASFTHMKV